MKHIVQPARSACYRGRGKKQAGFSNAPELVDRAFNRASGTYSILGMRCRWNAHSP
jgi:hypothetical protein